MLNLLSSIGVQVTLRLFRPKFFLGVGGIVMLLAVAIVLLRPQPGHAGQPTLLITRNDREISYSAAFDPVSQSVNGLVSYDYLSAQGTRDYVAFNRRVSQEIAQRRAGRVRVNMIFSRPLSQIEFEQLTRSYEATVHAYTMRAVEANGTRVTIYRVPDGGELVPSKFLEMIRQDISERSGAEFKGWIEAEVTTTPAHLGLMQHDARIFVTEATYTLIYDALTTQALRQAGAANETIQKVEAGMDRMVVQISGPPLYWSLEDAGLVTMPVHSQQ